MAVRPPPASVAVSEACPPSCTVAVLRSLHIRNLAIINDLVLEFAPGLNILTGETGAGKSIILDSLNLLLGGKAPVSLIRAGEPEASVTATVDAAGSIRVLERTVRSTGRSVCRLDGEVVTRERLRAAMQEQIEIHGQTDHLRLLNPDAHVDMLDRYGDLVAERETVAGMHARLQQVRRRLASSRMDARTVMQRIDMLQFQIREIEEARLVPGESGELETEQRRLADAESLRALAAEARMRLEEGDQEIPDILSQLGLVQAALDRLAAADNTQAALAAGLQEAMELCGDAGRRLGRYLDVVEVNPQRLAEVEARLAHLDQLQRKYGPTVEEVIEWGAKAAAELAGLEDQDGLTERLEAEEAELLQALAAACQALSAARQAAGRDLARHTEEELSELFGKAPQFEVLLEQEEAADGLPLPDGSRVRLDRTGIDAVSFLVSTNPGEPVKPLVDVASGGETSRLMLALKCALAAVDGAPTLVFDEIDQGIGGRMGLVVGGKLWQLAHPHGFDNGDETGHQVLCVTHLPQLAAFGDVHFGVRKAMHREDGVERTHTEVEVLKPADRLVELAAMQGTFTASGRQSVAEILGKAHAMMGIAPEAVCPSDDGQRDLFSANGS